MTEGSLADPLCTPLPYELFIIAYIAIRVNNIQKQLFWINTGLDNKY